MDEDSQKIVDWLKALPENTVVEWASDHLSKESPWSANWVDVRIPSAEAELKMNWVWTIVGPDDSLEDHDPEAVWTFIVPYDLDIHGVYTPETHWYANEIVMPAGRELNDEQKAQLAATEKAGPDRAITIRNGWSMAMINLALANWIKEYAGRADLQLKWNPNLPESEMLKAAKESLEKIKSGEAKTYNLGDGIEASEAVMDFMLEDLDRAAEIMKKFKDILGK